MDLVRQAFLFMGLGLMIALSGCSQSQTLASNREEQLSKEQLQLVGQRRIFFAHQSVGKNILAGTEKIYDESGIPLRIVPLKTAGSEGAGLFEWAVGQNELPATKDADFLRTLDAQHVRAGDVALYKYCFVDMQRSTDVNQLFQSYKSTILAAEKVHRGLMVIPVTMPLTTVESKWRYKWLSWRGKETDVEIDRKRNAFNDLLRREFRDRLIFDLAQAESRANGNDLTTDLDGSLMPVLRPEYSNDGSHLNPQGQREVASEFLRTLAKAVPTAQ